jgi:hypothetical protein
MPIWACIWNFLIVEKGRTNVPALGEDDAQEEDKKEHGSAYPAIGCEWGRGVEVGLVLL